MKSPALLLLLASISLAALLPAHAHPLPPRSRTYSRAFSYLPTVLTVRSVDTIDADDLPPPWHDPAGKCLPQTTTRNINISHALCDPTGLLSRRNEESLNNQLARVYAAEPPYPLVSCSATRRSLTGFRVAVLLVRRVPGSGKDLPSRVRGYVEDVFDDWGLDGHCGASVLVFVSWDDKQMYIKTGALAAKYVTEADIDLVFQQMAGPLSSGHIYNALSTGAFSVSTYLEAYQSAPRPQAPPPATSPKQPTPSPSSAPATGYYGSPLYWRGGPKWWDLEMSLLLLVVVVVIICACCNGMGGPDVARVKRERKALLVKLTTVRTEYIRSTLPDYKPSTCPITQEDLYPAPEPTPIATESDPLVSDQQQRQQPEVKVFRSGYAFLLRNLETLPEYAANPFRCPITGDTPGVDDAPRPMSETRGLDYRFRLGKLKDEYPTLLTDTVYAQISESSPTHWPDTLEDTFLKPRPAQASQTGTTTTTTTTTGNNRGGGNNGGGNWMGTVGTALAAGGIGAMIGSALSGGNDGNGNGGGGGSSSGGGGNAGGGSGGNGGHGANWTGGMRRGGGGGHGSGWGNFASGMGGWMGGSGRSGGGHGASFGGFGGGGHGASFGGGRGGGGGGGGHGSGF